MRRAPSLLRGLHVQQPEGQRNMSLQGSVELLEVPLQIDSEQAELLLGE